VPAPRHLVRPRVVFWGAVLLIGAAAAIALLLVGRSPRAAGNTAAPISEGPAATWPAGKLRAPDIELYDQKGTPFSLSSYRGRPVIVTFIDPLCRDYCPLEARHLNEVVRSFPAASQPAIVAVSVNVRGNDPAYLAQDATKWQLVPQWRWGIGTQPELASVWKRYHIGVLPTTKKIAGVTVLSVVHTEASYVIDSAGYERAIFLWPYSADAVTRILRGLTRSS
jgi:cytochrome oxidase Cu insertion factor (SCO1/SenC/PrrC family)